MKILVYKSNEKEQDALQHYVLEKAVIEVFDNVDELETVINSSLNNKLALVIPDVEKQSLKEWEDKIKSEYPRITLIALDSGISWQTSIKKFIEAPESNEPSMTVTDLDLDGTVNTENIEFITGSDNAESEIDTSELKFEASSVLNLSETSPTVLQLNTDQEQAPEADGAEIDLSDNGLEFDDVDGDKTQVISLAELSENLANNNGDEEVSDSPEVDLSDNGIDFGDDSLSEELGFLTDEELEEQIESKEIAVSDTGDLSIDENDSGITEIGLTDNNEPLVEDLEEPEIDNGTGLSFDESVVTEVSLASNDDLSMDEPEEYESDNGTSLSLDDSNISELSLANDDLSLSDSSLPEGLSLDEGLGLDEDLGLDEGLGLDEDLGLDEGLGLDEDLSLDDSLNFDENHEEAIDEDEIDISTDDLGIDDVNDELLSLDEELEEEIEELSMLGDDTSDEEIDDLLSFPDESTELKDSTEIKDITLTVEGPDNGESSYTLRGNALGDKLLSDDQLQEVIDIEVESEPGTASRLSFDNINDHEDDEIDESSFSIKDVEAVLGENSEGDSKKPVTEESQNQLTSNSSEQAEEESTGQSSEIDSQKLEEFSETIRDLREDREKLLSKIEEFEISKEQTKREHLTVEAQLDEKKIEINLSKKRFAEEYEKLNSKISELKDREHEGLGKNKELHAKVEQLNKKAYLDLRKIQMREKELESQLGLLKTDTENQVRNRDIIILDLKRKIDVLEFDIEQAWKQEKAAKREKLILQSKIDRLVSSLKEVVEALHGDDIKQWLDKVHEDDKDKL